MVEDERGELREALGRAQDAVRSLVYLCDRDVLTVMRWAPNEYLALIDAVTRRARDEMGITLTLAAGGAGGRGPGAGSEVEGGGKVREFEGPGSPLPPDLFRTQNAGAFFRPSSPSREPR